MTETLPGLEKKYIPDQQIQAPGNLANADYLVGHPAVEVMNAMCYQLPLNPNHSLLTAYRQKNNIPDASFLLQFGVTPVDQEPCIVMQVGPLKYTIALQELGIDNTPPQDYSISYHEDPAKQLVTLRIPGHFANANLAPLEMLFR